MTDDAPNPADLPADAWAKHLRWRLAMQESALLSADEWEAYLRRRQAEREAALPECFRNLGCPPSADLPF